MLFFGLTFGVGVLCIFVPILVARILCKKWKQDRTFFWKSGVAGVVASLIILAVSLNVDGTFANFGQLPVLGQALTLGLMTGLFMELGKFIVLDRILKKVRDRRSAVMFGLGWSGVGVIFTGALFMLGVFGMYNLVNTKDLAASFPNVNTEQLKFFQDAQKEIQELVSGSPLKALEPLLENGMVMMVDLAMSLLVVMAFVKKRNSLIWLAVLIHSLAAASVFFVLLTDKSLVEYVFAGWVVLGGLMSLDFYKRFSAT